MRVAPGCRIRRSELQWRFSGSGGPGGQHANTANTRVELRFDIAASPSLGAVHRARLVERLGASVRVVASDERSQLRNRRLALERLVALLREGLRVEATRRPTRPSQAARAARVQDKRHRSQTKQHRRRPASGDD